MQQHSHHSHHQPRPAIAPLCKVRMFRTQGLLPDINSSCVQRVRLVVLTLRLVRPREESSSIKASQTKSLVKRRHIPARCPPSHEYLRFQQNSPIMERPGQIRMMRVVSRFQNLH